MVECYEDLIKALERKHRAEVEMMIHMIQGKDSGHTRAEARKMSSGRVFFLLVFDLVWFGLVCFCLLACLPACFGHWLRLLASLLACLLACLASSGRYHHTCSCIASVLRRFCKSHGLLFTLTNFELA